MSDESATMSYPELLEQWRQVRDEILHVEQRLMELSSDLCIRERELTNVYAENGRLRNQVADVHAADAARRLLRRQALVKRDELASAIDACEAYCTEKALLQQHVAHLWTLADKAIGLGT